MNIQIFYIVVHIIVTSAFLKLGRTSQIPAKVSNTLVCGELQQSSMNKISVRCFTQVKLGKCRATRCSNENRPGENEVRMAAGQSKIAPT